MEIHFDSAQGNRGMGHVGLKSGHPKVAMHAILEREWVYGI